MSTRARDLARAFATANDELIGVLEQMSPRQWRRRVADEGELRPVGVIAHHVAVAHTRILRRVEALAYGLPVPARRPELFDERNAREARENPDPDQQATIELLRRAGAVVFDFVSRLNDEQLGRTGSEDPGAPPITTGEVIEQRQIGHVLGHLASIKETGSPG